MPNLVEVDSLAVGYPKGGTWRDVVDGVSLRLGDGGALGVVGESGSGKTLTSLALLGLVPEPGRITRGRVQVAGLDVVGAGESDLRRLRGAVVGMVFQDPALALNPVLRVGAQVVEAAVLHRRVEPADRQALASRLLEEVGLGGQDALRRAFPHQLSGGQRQRVMLASALAGNPSLVIADEPTASLDALARERFLRQVRTLREERGLALILISHDLALVAAAASTIAVLHAGETVESGPATEVMRTPLHPYTRALVRCARDGASTAGGALATVPGKVPEPEAWGPGCRFVGRCGEAFERCRWARPELVEVDTERSVRCFLYGEQESSDG
ncbi:MAG: ABC transporter ATP-binding protein [Acidobacteriota bacterium]